LKRLESIVHPAVLREIDSRVDAAREAGAKLIVIDCALLFESGLETLCDATVAVDAPEAVRIERARAAHGWDADELRRRTAAQLSPAEKRARAGRVVLNDKDESRLDDEARTIFENLPSGRRAGAARRTSS
jgi:dephospho-CoA kinase